MGLMNLILLTTMIWIILFFISLPIFIKMPDKVKIGNSTSAPEKHYLPIKILSTFLISIFLTIIINYSFY